MTYKMNGHDYSIRYGNAYAAIKRPDGMLDPIHIRDCRDRDDGSVDFRIKYWDKEKKRWRDETVKTTDKSLFLRYPQTGAINLSSGFVVLLARQCRRNWRVMPHNDLSKIVDPFKGERKHIAEFLSENYGEEDTICINTNVDSHGIGHYQFLRDLFNNKYYTGQEAIRQVEKGYRLAAAINPNWYIGITSKSDVPMVFRKEYIVGEIQENSILLQRSLKFLREEATNTGLEVNVK